MAARWLHDVYLKHGKAGGSCKIWQDRESRTPRRYGVGSLIKSIACQKSEGLWRLTEQKVCTVSRKGLSGAVEPPCQTSKGVPERLDRFIVAANHRRGRAED